MPREQLWGSKKPQMTFDCERGVFVKFWSDRPSNFLLSSQQVTVLWSLPCEKKNAGNSKCDQTVMKCQPYHLVKEQLPYHLMTLLPPTHQCQSKLKQSTSSNFAQHVWKQNWIPDSREENTLWHFKILLRTAGGLWTLKKLSASACLPSSCITSLSVVSCSTKEIFPL